MTNNIKFVIPPMKRGYTPSPFPSPLDAFGVSNSAPIRRLGSQAPSTQNPGYASASDDKDFGNF